MWHGRRILHKDWSRTLFKPSRRIRIPWLTSNHRSSYAYLPSVNELSIRVHLYAYMYMHMYMCTYSERDMNMYTDTYIYIYCKHVCTYKCKLSMIRMCVHAWTLSRFFGKHRQKVRSNFACESSYRYKYE